MSYLAQGRREGVVSMAEMQQNVWADSERKQEQGKGMELNQGKSEGSPDNQGEKRERGHGLDRKRAKKWTWLLRGLAVSFVAAAGFTACYGFFKTEAENYMHTSLETEEKVRWLYQNTYVLYRDLYNRVNQEQNSYLELYFPSEYLNLWNGEGEISDTVEEVKIAGVEYYEWLQLEGAFQDIFQEMEVEFTTLNDLYDYVIRDDETGYYMSNLSKEELDNIELQSNYFLLSFHFDNAGNASVEGPVYGLEPDLLRRTAGQVTKNSPFFAATAGNILNGPRNCTVTYVISAQSWAERPLFYDVYRYSFWAGDIKVSYYEARDYTYYGLRWAYRDAGVIGYLLLIMLAVFLLGCFLPLGERRPWRERGICALPFEILVVVGIVVFAGAGVALDIIAAVASGQGSVNWGFLQPLAQELALAGNILFFTVYFLFAWYLGVCARAIWSMGVREYIRQRSLSGRLLRYVNGTVKKVYDFFIHVDLTKNSLRTIRKLVFVNAIILTVICLSWLGGLGVVVVYSVLLYFILKKYVGDLQKRYGILLKAVDEMAEGNLNVTIEEDLGVFEPFKPQVIKIQNGFKKAVEEEVKSQRMKAELITNVSHDLKTPLTAIITYVNLLKDPGLTEEQRREYLDIMERKSLRLKVLIEDLFEVSKANSRNATLNLVPVDIMNLIKQVSFEMKDKLEEAQLDMRMNLGEEKISLSLDSQKTYRIYENLFSNVAKYALRGTRVYVNGFRIDDTVVITIKNISAQELTVETSELTERFVRGDASRNTEGSGLGLAIAKSFMELQGGELELEVDGDLFKVTTIWHM